ncbi:unnamed protein product, partial [Cuscuta epithymum]
MDLRSRRRGKEAEGVKSQNMDRIIEPSDCLNATEKLIYRWVMQKDAKKKDEIIFKFKDLTIMRADMLTLGDKEHMSMKVLDAWTVYLNSNEKLRSKDSPC